MSGFVDDGRAYILECIIHKRDERDEILPIRHMYGPFEGFERAHAQIAPFTRQYETILIHRLERPREKAIP